MCFLNLPLKHALLSCYFEMKKCDVCNKLGKVQYRCKSINNKTWIFSCKECWDIISKQEKYCYGGTRKS